MPCEDVVGSRLAALREIIRSGFGDAPSQVQGFIIRVLKREIRYSDEAALYKEEPIEHYLEAVRFDGYPALARAGYSLARGSHPPINAEMVNRFLHCIEQQRLRPTAKQAELAGDALV